MKQFDRDCTLMTSCRGAFDLGTVLLEPYTSTHTSDHDPLKSRSWRGVPSEKHLVFELFFHNFRSGRDQIKAVSSFTLKLKIPKAFL